MEPTTGDRKKITNKVHEKSGNEGTVDSRNANKCDALQVGLNAIEIIGVVGSKIANNRNGLACSSDSNSYRMSGRVVESGSLSALSTPARYRKMIDVMKFTKKGPEVIDKEGADVDSRSIDNCNVLGMKEQ